MKGTGDVFHSGKGSHLTGNCRDQVGALAEALVLAEARDLQALGDLHLRFKAVGEFADGAYAREAGSLCALAQAALERIIMGETKDAGAEMGLVGKCVVCLQGLLCEDRPPGELPIPAELTGNAPTAKPNAPMEEVDVPDADAGLTADFVRESLEHLENADVLLMSLESDPTDKEAVNGLFRAFHTIKGVAGFLGFKTIQAFAHGTENLLDLVRQGSIALDTRIIDVAFAAVDVMRKRMQWAAVHGGQAAPDEVAAELRAVLDRVEAAAEGRPDGAAAPALPPAEPGMRLGEILMAGGSVPPEAVEGALRAQEEARERPLGETLVKVAGIPAKEVGLALRSQKLARDTQAAQVVAAVKETVKVEAERLDRLLDAIGELVIAETMIFQSRELKGITSPGAGEADGGAGQDHTGTAEDGNLPAHGAHPARVPEDGQAGARPGASKVGQGRRVRHCFGDETELDKTVVDKIGDPLVHMVRNSRRPRHRARSRSPQGRRQARPAKVHLARLPERRQRLHPDRRTTAGA